MNYREVMAAARGNMGKCKACPVCNGLACRNTVPGPGAKGVGDTAIRNYEMWQRIRVNMDTLCPYGEADTRFTLFGRTFAAPLFAGPVGAVTMHYSDLYNDQTYNAALVSGCAKAGIAAFTGDGLDANVMVQATKAIRDVGGVGVPTVKPWNMELIREKMTAAQDAVEAQEFTASVGGGVVEAKVNGKKEVLSVNIKPEAVDPEDVEMLQDLVVSAVNEALRQAGEAMDKSMEGVTGGLDLSGFGL